MRGKESRPNVWLSEPAMCKGAKGVSQSCGEAQRGQGGQGGRSRPRPEHGSGAVTVPGSGGQALPCSRCRPARAPGRPGCSRTAVSVHEGRVDLGVAALQEGAHGRGAAGHVHDSHASMAPKTVAGRVGDTPWVRLWLGHGERVGDAGAPKPNAPRDKAVRAGALRRG